ncbi:MAG: hypothetical protein ACRCUT_01865, partial [Spirochaetota bacterium]
ARSITAVFLAGEQNSVQLTWDAPSTAQDSFIVLRSSYIQNNPGAVLNSVPIKIIEHGTLRMVLDRNLLPGRYYYSVIPKTKFDQRNIQLFPGENYTTNPLIIASELSIGDTRTVASLKAVTVDDRTVLLTWDPIGNFTGEYVIFRGRMPIDSAEKMNLSEPIARISSAKSRYLDTDSGPGRHYYSIACKTVDGILYSELKKDFNYTRDAVFVGGIIGVRNIKAGKDGSSVVITWKSAVDALNKNYYLLRSEVRPAGKESIAGSTLIDSVQSVTEKYTDRNVPAGKYFYILAPANYKDDEDFTLARGVNVTDPAVTIPSSGKREKKEIPPPAQGSESPSPAAPDVLPEKESDAAVIPVIPHAEKEPGKESTEDDFLSHLEEIPFSQGQGVTPDMPSPEAAVPEQIPLDEITPKALPGLSADSTRTATSEQSQNTIVLPGAEPAHLIKAPAIHSTARKTAAMPRKKQSEHRRQPSPDAEQEGYGAEGVYRVVQQLYRSGNYRQTVSELKRIIPSSGEKEAAAARYYIGRSYVEMKRYREAIQYLTDEDVRKYYPKESEFWRDFTLEHMK